MTRGVEWGTTSGRSGSLDGRHDERGRRGLLSEYGKFPVLVTVSPRDADLPRLLDGGDEVVGDGVDANLTAASGGEDGTLGLPGGTHYLASEATLKLHA